MLESMSCFPTHILQQEVGDLSPKLQVTLRLTHPPWRLVHPKTTVSLRSQLDSGIHDPS